MKNLIATALFLVLASAFNPTKAESQEPVAGRDYIEIPNGKPLEAAEGIVVVEEFFNYICPACYKFEPTFSAWTKDLPSHVRVVHVPTSFRADFIQYAKAYYAARAFNLVDKTHSAVYDAIHRSRVLPGEDARPDEERIAEFYSEYGVDGHEFLVAMRSFEVDMKIRQATEHMKRSRVLGTPSLVVNGRYLIRGRTLDDMLRVADYLIEKEHSE